MRPSDDRWEFIVAVLIGVATGALIGWMHARTQPMKEKTLCVT